MDRQLPAGLAPEDIGSNPTANRPFAAIAEARFSRRTALAGLLAGTALAALPGAALAQALGRAGGFGPFTEVPHGLDERDHVAEGHDIQVLLRWGDPILPGAPAFDVNAQTAAAQAMQFGYNCDFVGFLPLPAGGTGGDRGLLFVNHEYTNTNLMFAGLGDGRRVGDAISAAQADIEIAAHGAAVVEIARAGGRWRVVADSPYNRRLTGTTPHAVSGPARGHAKLRTKADPTGTLVLGTLNNCAGGVTPWGTVVTAEENFNQYFANAPETAEYRRLGVGRASAYGWHRFHERFDVAKEPNEPNRFGWMVEVDPYDPTSMPVKRTALGRFKHEGAHFFVNRDGRVVAYMGDDERFDYVYRFVSARRMDRDNRRNNWGILDEGTLSVARFADDGTLAWLPLVWGEGPLTPDNGFASQADVLIETRRAADLVGATPMDRPEDVEPNPVTGKVYVLLTNNANRKPEQVNGANPRANNTQGHIVELIPPGGSGADSDHTAPFYRWEMLLAAGNPAEHPGTLYHADTSAAGWLSCPDNCVFDARGRMWVATDGAPGAAKVADGLYAVETEGPKRGLSRAFYRAPQGAEVCGPCFTPDDTTLFLAIQHPGEDRGSTFESPSTRWPDFAANMPPRPSVIAITKKGGGPIA